MLKLTHSYEMKLTNLLMHYVANKLDYKFVVLITIHHYICTPSIENHVGESSVPSL